MNVTNKEQNNYSRSYMCRNHNIKPDRDIFRTCPSKLSKRELEDLYFALLDNNVELKRTINTLRDNNKLLNTKVHRMTAAQKTNIGKEKDCCVTTKALVQEQRDAIVDLNRVNERMSERIQVLNMRLCSAKQFLRRSPSQTTSRGIKSLTVPPASLKNSSVSMLNTKDSSPKVMTAIQIPLEKEAMSSRTVETETSDQENVNTVRECNENKCRTLMEELKHRIVCLQEELTNCHKEYSSRISRLESEMTTLHNDKQKALAASSHGLQQRSHRVDMLADKLRAATGRCNDLEAQLLIERRKVAELETRLKATDLSNQMAKTIETRLCVVDEDKKSPKKDRISPPKEPLLLGPQFSSSSPNIWNESSPKLLAPRAAPRRLSPGSARGHHGGDRHSDDSGYTDTGRTSELDDHKALAKVNEELMKKVMDLQKQLDALRVANAGKTRSEPALNNVSECPMAIEEIKQIYLHNATERDSPYQDLRQDCEPSTSNAASPENGSKIQKHHGEKKTQELNEANKLWENYDSPFDKKVLGETGPQTKTEEKIHFAIDETILEREKETTEKRKSVTKTDHNSHQIERPVNVPEEKTKEKRSMKSSYDKIRDAINTKLRQAKSSQGSKSKKVPNDEIEATDRKFEKIPAELKNDATFHIYDVADSNLKDNFLEENNKGALLKDRDSSDNLYFPSHDAGNMASADDRQENNEISRNFSRTFVYGGRQSNASVDKEQVKTQPLDICQQYVRVCNCPKLQRRNVTVFRSCSGTLRFRTTDESDNIRLCQCYDSSIQTDGTSKPPVASECHTYTVQDAGAASRVNSPDNTDQEISSITDLPSEGDGKSPRAALSPGEDKTTSTYTESYTETYTGHTNHTDAGSLSEGELPLRYAGRQSTSECRERAMSTTTEGKPVPVAQKMEAALQSIGEELARCRQLLERQRPQEVTFWSSM